jgi:hypothetical protein
MLREITAEEFDLVGNDDNMLGFEGFNYYTKDDLYYVIAWFPYRHGTPIFYFECDKETFRVARQKHNLNTIDRFILWFKRGIKLEMIDD